MLVSKCSVIVFKSDKQVAMVPDDVQTSKRGNSFGAGYGRSLQIVTSSSNDGFSLAG